MKNECEKNDQSLDELKSLSLSLDSDVLRKINLIERNLKEIPMQDRFKLRRILKERNLKIYWGTAITGKPHIAYYLAMLKLRDFLEAGCEVTVLFADIHGMLDNVNSTQEEIDTNTLYYEKLIKTMLQQLIDLEKVKIKFVLGSSFQLNKDYVFDLYKLSTITKERDLKKAGSEVVKQTENVFLSSLIYPNMQALDEEYLGVDAQFGGVDQRKIFMHAGKFLPKLGYGKRIHFMSHMIPGLTSEKMSSSIKNSKIEFSDTKDAIKKKINAIFCEERNIEKNGILSLYRFLFFVFFKNEELLGCNDYQALEDKFASGEIHPKELKMSAIELIDRIVSPIREVMNESKDFASGVSK